MGQTTRKRVQKAYDQIAAQYAAVNAAMPPEVAASARRFLELTSHQARILDLGCGAGRDMAWFEAQGTAVVGLDLSRLMLDQARRCVHGPLLQMDMCNLGLPAGCVQGVWCNATLLHLPKDEAPEALAEMQRITAPGGILFLSVQEGEGETWEEGLYGTAERFFARYSEEEMAGLLTASGYKILERSFAQSGTRRWISFIATVRVHLLDVEEQGIG
jgi:ubiquinone/menaquinone biosynthesis C-methylase UbiE